MKKLFALLMFVPLLFAACDDKKEEKDPTIVGTWTVTSVTFDVEGDNTEMVDYINANTDDLDIFADLEGMDVIFNEDGSTDFYGAIGTYTVSDQAVTLDMGEEDEDGNAVLYTFIINELTETTIKISLDVISMVEEVMGAEIPTTDISKIDVVISGTRK